MSSKIIYNGYHDGKVFRGMYKNGKKEGIWKRHGRYTNFKNGELHGRAYQASNEPVQNMRFCASYIKLFFLSGSKYGQEVRYFYK